MNDRALTIAAEQAPRLRSLALRLTHNEADADDALQRGLMIVWEKCPEELRSHQVRAWARTTVLNEAKGIARSARRREALPLIEELLDGGSDPGEIVVDREVDRERADVLDVLKPDERTALVMQGAGYSYREIAALQGWTYTKVNRCITEGRAALRQRLDLLNSDR